MTTPDTRSPSPVPTALPSTHWLKSNLAALGSAAVLTVYAAGWARTKAAADLLEEQSERRLPPRRPAARAAMGQVEGAAVARTSAPVTSEPAATTPAGPGSAATTMSSERIAAAPAPGVTPTNESVATPATVEPRAKPLAASAIAPATIASAPKPSAVPTTAATASALATPASAATNATPAATPPANPTATTAPSVVASAPSTTPAPAPAQPAAPAAAIVPGAPRELATDAQATASAAKTAAAPAGPVTYKDGLYSGWGTSRHGDIEAYVEIKDGRIKSAFIGECLTQYSCSWISKLPGWVVEAQSPETDYISGATHSSNAFYYAIVNALKKAAK